MRLFIFFIIATFVVVPMLSGQGNTRTNVEKLPPYQRAFANLPLNKRTDFIKHQREAARLYSEKRIIESLESLKLAEKVFDQSPDLHNLRGSCYVEFRAFDKAMTSYRKALSIAEGNILIMFNIAEVYFVTRQWQQAHDKFDALIRQVPEENVGLVRISEFKLMLCKLKLGKKQDAEILAMKYDYRDDTPFYYFAMASLAFEKEENTEAERWIARAGRIFRNPAIIDPWRDTLAEYGYIKSSLGGGGLTPDQ